MKRNRHEWTKRTPEGRRVYRAWLDRGEWVVQWALDSGGRSGRRRAREEGTGIEWQDELEISLEDLKLFREVLWNKYQRGRVAYKQVEKIDAMIEEKAEEELASPNVEEGIDGEFGEADGAKEGGEGFGGES